MSLRFLLIAVLCTQATVSYSKVLNPCEVADVMYKLGQKKVIVSKWVCLAKFASGFNTQALSPTKKDGSNDFGIFQINDKYCRLGSTNSCGVPCTDLVQDDIVQSAKCALKIYQKEGGFKAWPAFNNNCQAIDTSRFIIKCSLKAPSFFRRRFDLNLSDEEEYRKNAL
ncbi:lysozyme C-like [Argiope bruennichi]|uniref:lysozyme n=1 Tax=Argiope bruennichi TaxID=94029 RepID=A0A8T0FTP6_ARGBR|nr:lysozyme C-like [Argiope bruennichi]KAF8792083.1 Lysozyme C-1 like protein [Argiope bruennichi]